MLRGWNVQGITPQVHSVLNTGQPRNHPLFDLPVGQCSSREFLPMRLIDPDHLVLVALAGFAGVVSSWQFGMVQKLPTLDLPH
jgi:hypothetical protein